MLIRRLTVTTYAGELPSAVVTPALVPRLTALTLVGWFKDLDDHLVDLIKSRLRHLPSRWQLKRSSCGTSVWSSAGVLWANQLAKEFRSQDLIKDSARDWTWSLCSRVCLNGTMVLYLTTTPVAARICFTTSDTNQFVVSLSTETT
jgi:hypothetical protein